MINMIEFFDKDMNGTINFSDFKVLMNLLIVKDEI